MILKYENTAYGKVVWSYFGALWVSSAGSNRAESPATHVTHNLITRDVFTGSGIVSVEWQIIALQTLHIRIKVF